MPTCASPSPTSTGSRSGSRRRARARWEGSGGEPEIAIADPSQNGLPDLLRALKELTPAQRAAVYLHYRADMPVRQVAQLLGMSTASVKVHLMRGRRRLASLLGEEDES